MSKENLLTTISVKNLVIGYKNTTVADTLNFDTLPGELVGIVGINGIGKSTLLRTLGKVQPKLSGSIEIKAKSLEEYKSIALASEISMVLTEALPTKNMTVWELIALGRHPYTNWLGSLTETDKTKISEAIQMLELAEMKHKICYELSDGQLQRVMIARAIAQDTSIILLDEPTTHLDLYHKVLILKLLQRIAHETKKTILFTSHEIDIALQLCDKVLLLDGKVNPFNTPDILIKNNAFESLFPNDTIKFNSETRSFQIQK